MGKIWGNMGGKIPHISPIFSPYFTPPHNGGTSMPRGGGGGGGGGGGNWLPFRLMKKNFPQNREDMS